MSIAAIIVAVLVIASYAEVAWPVYFLAFRMRLAASVSACIGIALASVALIIIAVTETAAEVPYVLGTTCVALALHGVLMLLTVRSAMAAAAAEDAEQTF